MRANWGESLSLTRSACSSSTTMHFACIHEQSRVSAHDRTLRSSKIDHREPLARPQVAAEVVDEGLDQPRLVALVLLLPGDVDDQRDLGDIAGSGLDADRHVMGRHALADPSAEPLDRAEAGFEFAVELEPVVDRSRTRARSSIASVDSRSSSTLDERVADDCSP